MRYEKPTFTPHMVVPQCIWAFLDSLPDSFEILGDGEVAVRWPEGLTREVLCNIADGVAFFGRTADAENGLRRLAAIAPEAPKKQKRIVEIWEYFAGGRMEAWPSPLDPRRNVVGWRKVAGPIELED